MAGPAGCTLSTVGTIKGGPDVATFEAVEGGMGDNPRRRCPAPATGAYRHAMASNRNRLPGPAMVLVDDGRAALLVRRETLDDVLARDVDLGERG